MVEGRQGDDAVPKDAGHSGVHLRNDDGCALKGGPRDVHAYPKGTEPVSIGRGNMQQGNVDGSFSGAYQLRHFRKKAGEIIDSVIIEFPSEVAANKQAYAAKALLVLGL